MDHTETCPKFIKQQGRILTHLIKLKTNDVAIKVQSNVFLTNGKLLGKIDPKCLYLFSPKHDVENIWCSLEIALSGIKTRSAIVQQISDNLLGFNEHMILLHLTVCSSSTVIFCARNGIIFYLLKPDLFIFAHQVVSHPHSSTSTGKISKASDSVSSS